MRTTDRQGSAALPLILAAASWGFGTVISKRAVAEIPPLGLLVIQLSVSVLALVIVVGALRLARPGAVPGSASAAGLGRLGLLNPGAAYALSLIGLTQITASLSVLLWAAEPLLILALAYRFLREPMSPRLVGLSIAAALGMLLVLAGPGAGGGIGGIILTLAGVACCAVYTVLARRMIGDAPSTLRVVLAQQAWALAFGLVVVALAQAAGLEPLPPAGTSVSAEAWVSAAGSGLLYYAVAYLFYLSGLRNVPASVAASAFYLIPVFGVAGGWVVLGERLGPAQWLGAAVVVGCLVGIARSGSARLKPFA